MTAAIVMFAASPPAALAGGGYPHEGAPRCGKAPSEWCVKGKPMSLRGYYYKNCTDWAAWRLQQMGASDASTRGLGHGGQWASKAGASRVYSTPAVGRAAVQASSGYGHVAVVEAVHGGGEITVSEYNVPFNSGAYRTWRGKPSAREFSKFVDFGIRPSPPPPPPSPSVIGAVDAAQGIEGGFAWIRGWALDPEANQQSTSVHVYIDGPAGSGARGVALESSLARPDVARAHGGSAEKGFDTAIDGLGPGRHKLYVYGINTAGPAGNPLLREVTVDVPHTRAGSPFGTIDGAKGLYGSRANAVGWTIDPDDRSAPTDVHVYIDGPAGSGASGVSVRADKPRPDVGEAHSGAGSAHGLDSEIDGLSPGTHTLWVYAINQAGEGGNPLLGTRTVTVPPGGAPLGHFDDAKGHLDGTATLAGWTFDPDEPRTPNDIHVYVDGPAGSGARGINLGPADRARPDVGKAFPGAGDDHGFESTVDGLAPGTHTLWVYAINKSGGGDNPLLDRRTVTVPGGSPIGVIDSAQGGAGLARVEGWTIDPDDPTTSTDVHVYVDGPAGSGARGLAFRADGSRPDVSEAYPGAGSDHGLRATVDELTPGRHTLWVYAINAAGGGDNPLLARREVDVSGPPTAVSESPSADARIDRDASTATVTSEGEQGKTPDVAGSEPSRQGSDGPTRENDGSTRSHDTSAPAAGDREASPRRATSGRGPRRCKYVRRAAPRPKPRSRRATEPARLATRPSSESRACAEKRDRRSR